MRIVDTRNALVDSRVVATPIVMMIVMVVMLSRGVSAVIVDVADGDFPTNAILRPRNAADHEGYGRRKHKRGSNCFLFHAPP